MPNLSGSVEVDGKYYCWDEKTGDIYEIDAKFIPVNMPPHIKQAVKLLIEKAKGG
jgi:hypothetical protein